jgi:dTDP-glucose 4,6-dehydratase
MLLNAIEGKPLPIYGDGLNVRDWLYVEDHCRALCEVLTKGNVGDTYAIGGNNERRNIDLVRLLCSMLDDLTPRDDGRSYAEQIVFVADRPGHDFHYAIDAGKIRRELSWRPEHEGDAGFRSTVAWYLEHRDWWQAILNGDYRLQRQGLPA